MTADRARAGDDVSKPGGVVATGYSTPAEIRHVSIPASAAETAGPVCAEHGWKLSPLVTDEQKGWL